MVFLVGPLAEAGAEGSCEIGRVCPSLSVSSSELRAWKKSGSQVMAKIGSRPRRFQYSFVVNISSID